jgi:ankyrin repeat protein
MPVAPQEHGEELAIAQRFEKSRTAYFYAAAANHLGFDIMALLCRNNHPPLDSVNDYRKIFDCGELAPSEHWVVYISSTRERLSEAHMQKHDMATLSELMAQMARSK